MSKPKILVFSPCDEPREIISGIEKAGYAVTFGAPEWIRPGGDHAEAFRAAASDAVALMGTSIRNTPVSRRILESAPNLKIVAKYTVGVDDIDVEAASELGILVTHAPTEANCFAVAETTLGLILTIVKKIRERDAGVKAGEWREQKFSGRFVGRRLSDGYPGLTIGLVGLGRIGRRVADLFAPWRVRILAYDPHVEPGVFLLHGVERVDYETLLAHSDVVSFHCNLTRETRHILSENALSIIKEGAVVVNTARGKIIDEPALARAITAGRVRAAAIDAFEVEPLPADSPLRPLGDKVLFAPHAASFSEGGELGPGIEWAARSVLLALGGGVPDNVFNREVLPRWSQRFVAA